MSPKHERNGSQLGNHASRNKPSDHNTQSGQPGKKRLKRCGLKFYYVIETDRKVGPA